MSTNIEGILDSWKDRRFRSTEIPLATAVNSLSTNKPLVEAKPGLSASRWLLHRTDDGKPAILTYPFVWHWGTHLETGNFVPPPETPVGIIGTRVVRHISPSCELTFIFDTTGNPDFHDCMVTLDQYVDALPTFNQSRVARKVWQNNISDISRTRYQMSSKLFIRRAPGKQAQQSDRLHYTIHPWIVDALQSSRHSYVPNPDRPLYFDYEDEHLIKIEDATPPRFQKGDIIWVSFRVGFVMGSNSWHSQLIPVDLVRVGRLADSAEPFWPSNGEYTPLEEGAVALPDNDQQQSRAPKRSPSSSHPPASVTEDNHTTDSTAGDIHMYTPSRSPASGDDGPRSKRRKLCPTNIPADAPLQIPDAKIPDTITSIPSFETDKENVDPNLIVTSPARRSLRRAKPKA